LTPSALVFLIAMLGFTPAEAAECPRGTLAGEVTYVRDGDTIVVGTMPIRLNGLAAPEGDEPGGAAATRAMVELVQGRTLRCELDGDHARPLRRCLLPRGPGHQRGHGPPGVRPRL
jgi:endonuclease YncB( thermonuclease family)